MSTYHFKRRECKEDELLEFKEISFYRWATLVSTYQQVDIGTSLDARFSCVLWRQ
jgi:hypothetical protein